MIFTLAITIVIESVLVIGYSIWQKKPLYPILFTSICANAITQSFLWVVLILFFRHYLPVLLVVEIMIWLVEGWLLAVIPYNRLAFSDSLLLSLGMNLASFSLGLLLPL